MPDLESLTVLKGVVAALRFHDDGTLAEAAGHVDQIDLELAAELCYANGRIMHHGSDMLATLSGTGGWPPRGWMMMGDELSVWRSCGSGLFCSQSRGVFQRSVPLA